MMVDSKKKKIRAQAQNMLRSGLIGDLAPAVRIKAPMAIQMPEGRLHSWFVPVTASTQLIGFFQFLSDGTFMRFSSFQRKAGELTGCPPAAHWLDPRRIQARAEVQRKPDETRGQPFLTYDKTPDRLVWAVPFTTHQGGTRLVYVVGETVYALPPEGTDD